MRIDPQSSDTSIYCCRADLPGTDFVAHDLILAPDGSSVAILDKGQFCLLYETDADESLAGPNAFMAGEGLSHVMEEEEDWEAGQASFMSSNMGAVLA